MKIQIINMYFSEEDFERDLFTGTAHIRLIDLNLEIKGIYFKKKKNFWLVSIPSNPFTNEETKKRMRYPVLTFSDKEQNQLFQLQVKQLIYQELELRLMQKCVS